MKGSAEQQARDMLCRMGWTSAASLSAGELVELANLINDGYILRALLKEAQVFVPGDDERTWDWDGTGYLYDRINTALGIK